MEVQDEFLELLDEREAALALYNSVLVAATEKRMGGAAGASMATASLKEADVLRTARARYKASEQALERFFRSGRRV